MRKNRHISFKDLVRENKRELLGDQEAMERIEKKLEEKHTKKA
ncbi:FbpB family small basic protein [Fictibacillus sp. WQ 8-8]|uniref:FbpB family small basic protein n=1 Tax=Fictibacillus marinisediminis TaxID=2878389 RepID=A0A9X1XA96_9BACL|nr:MULTISPECIES: FbpB family small basic protein [Fictibacillus]MCK6257132.1 FbpB family small basic protein [Fictibacillus marinisediminis]MCQ6267171.1 FbpB family small basic protein [Fictibacillus sp. WQ 8-8]MED2973179.1 FbpB family small basic protein [Fictibacillus sp. B-59209]UZJ77037.1 FbpB family small basic protein [Fictibacillus sp. KU28468]